MGTQDGPIIFLSHLKMLTFLEKYRLRSRKYKNKLLENISLMNIPNCRILLWSPQELTYRDREHLILKHGNQQ